MPPPLLFDVAPADLERVVLGKDAIYRHLPQRYEFQVLDGICLADPAQGRVVAFADVRATDWWVRGHVPGRPLLPGVIMLEMAAQATAVMARLKGVEPFIAFGGVENCKFREPVVPPVRLYILGVLVEHRPRRIVSDTQGAIGGRLVFEARITGLTIPD